MEGYAKSNGFEWPVLVDESRETERAFGIQISLSNIYQWFVIGPDGQTTRLGGSGERVPAAIDQLLPNAKFLFAFGGRR